MPEPLRPEDFRECRKPILEASGLPRHVYLDPEVFAVERERIFKKEWAYVAHVSQLRNPGDYVALKIYDHPVLVARGKDAVIRAFHNVCRHRGMVVADGCGNTGLFSCPYHAWSYDLTGRLVAMPAMEQAIGFDAAQFPLIEIRTEIIHGLVFINFDNRATPLSHRIPDLIELLAPWRIEDMEPVHRSEIGGRFNWKTMVENGSEAYHVLAVHRESFNDISPAENAWTTDNRGRAWMDVHTPYVSPEAMPCGPVIPGVPKWAREKLSFYQLHPQFNMSVSADSVITYVTHIDGPESTRYIWTMYMPRTSLNWEGFDKYMSEMGPWIDRVNEEDIRVCQGVHIGMKSDGWRPGRFSHLELPVWQFHNWYLDRMLGENEPAVRADFPRHAAARG